MTGKAHLPLRYYAGELVALFQKSITAADPAVFLYKNNARSALFMAESLARLLKALDEGPKTGRALRALKKPEDILGEADYYDNCHRQFSKNKQVSHVQLEYFEKKRDSVFAKLNKKLRKKDYYQEPFNQLAAMRIDFNENKLITGIENQIREELKESAGFFAKYPLKFTEFESQVHELRRKLRWVSIYSQSLGGIIVLKTPTTIEPWQKEFQSKNSLDSNFNKVPLKKGLAKYIYFNRNAFYALNYTIARLGVIKDKALAIEALARSIKKTGLADEGYTETALKQLGVSYTEKDLLQEAHQLLVKFFISFKIHEKLL